MNPEHLLTPGRNCWRTAHTSRFALLVDAAACFAAVRAGLRSARHSIFILSWDIDSRVRLVPEGAHDGWPEPLGDFLHELVSARPTLHARLLNWDYTMLYAMEREWLPSYRLGWRTHNRLHFRLDGRHPVGAAHHQKVIVVDDALAFVGGFDLTRARWDTPEHRWHDERRKGTDGQPCEPFHDVQAMVDGDAARALGELCRERWRRATGQVVPLAARNIDKEDRWPEHVVPDLRDLEIGIARTEPEFDGRPAVHEIAQWYSDVIARANHSLVFENQYFTSTLVADALVRRLIASHGPQVLVVSPQRQSGWLEEATMGVLRSRVHRRLQQADGHGRYRLVCPALPDDGEGYLNVHSKLCFADDDALTVGSANLSNRSLACDTECNLCVVADGPTAQRERLRQGIAALRARLLGEHLAAAPDRVLAACRPPATLFDAIDALSRPPRYLKAFEPLAQPEMDALIPQQPPFDPGPASKPAPGLASWLHQWLPHSLPRWLPHSLHQWLPRWWHQGWPHGLPQSGRDPLARRIAALALLVVMLCGVGALLAVTLLLAGLGIAMRRLVGIGVERQ